MKKALLIAVGILTAVPCEAAVFRTRVRNLVLQGDFVYFNTTDTMPTNVCGAVGGFGRKVMPPSMTAAILMSKALGTASVVNITYTVCDSTNSPVIIHIDKIELE